MIHLDKPEAETVRVLSREALGEPRGRRNFEVVEHDDCAHRRLVHCEKQGVLAFCGIWRAVDKNEFRLLQTDERFPLRRDIERLDRPQTIPTAGERHDVGEIRMPF